MDGWLGSHLLSAIITTISSLQLQTVMAYLRYRIWIRILIRTANQMATFFTWKRVRLRSQLCQLQEWDRNHDQNQNPDL